MNKWDLDRQKGKNMDPPTSYRRRQSQEEKRKTKSWQLERFTQGNRTKENKPEKGLSFRFCVVFCMDFCLVNRQLSLSLVANGDVCGKVRCWSTPAATTCNYIIKKKQLVNFDDDVSSVININYVLLHTLPILKWSYFKIYFTTFLLSYTLVILL